MNEPAPWTPGDSPDEVEARRLAHERLSAAARRVGLPIRTLHDLLAKVAHNEAATRKFLADEVYGVPDVLLDDLVRIRLTELGGL